MSRPAAPRKLRASAVLFWLGYLLLLSVPAIAVYCLARDTGWIRVAAWLTIVSVATFAAYGEDKRRARRGDWRIPESYLHLLELAGGWPSAFIARHHFRHKTRKTSYLIVSWIIVLFHEYLAIDYMIGWELARSIFRP